MNKTIVTVITLAYNHESYIRECLEGIVMQKTNFAYELLIHDDASTDNTANIIREYEGKYPEIIKPVYQTENQYSKKTGIIRNILLPRIKSKYIAMCEGDDYWTDPYKLQKQVDFLEANPDYGVVYANVDYLFQDKNKRIKTKYKPQDCPVGNVFEDILQGKLPIVTQTVCCRAALLKDSLQRHHLYSDGTMIPSIDLTLWLGMSLITKFHYMDEVMATYRLLQESSSRSKNYNKRYLFHQKIVKIRFYYMRNNKVSVQTRHKVFQIYYDGLLTDGFLLNNKRLMYRGRKGLKILGVRL